MTRLTLDELREPIIATCGRCGNEEAVILPDPMPRGTFHCGPCYEASVLALLDAERKADEERARRRRLLIEWNAFVNGRETTEAELRALDGDR